MKTPSNQTGKPLRANDFYDRAEFLAEIWQRVAESTKILLLAPRRGGKSSLLFRLESEALQRGFEPLVISVSDVQSEIQSYDGAVLRTKKLEILTRGSCSLR